MDSGSASPGDEAEPGAVPGQQRTAAEAVEQAATVTPPRDRRKRYSEADRLERRRARNRAAQARFRQKQRDARSALESRINERQRKISCLRATCASLRLQKQDIRKRLTAANACLKTQAISHPPAADPGAADHVNDSSASPSSSWNHTQARAVLRPPDSPRQPSPKFTGIPSQRLPPSPAAEAQGGHPRFGTLVRQRLKSVLCAPSMLPPPVSSFRFCDSVSYRDVLEASGESGAYVDFSQCSLRALVGVCKAQKAARLHTAPSDVCWYMLTEYAAAPGLLLSYSSTLSSPQCVASMAIHFLLMSFEFALCTSAADAGGSDGDNCSPREPNSMPHSTHCAPGPDAFHPTAGRHPFGHSWRGDAPPNAAHPLHDGGPLFCDQPLHDPDTSTLLPAPLSSAASMTGAPAAHSIAQHAQHADPMAQMFWGRPPAQDLGEDGEGSLQRAAQHTAHVCGSAPQSWDGMVSCGVNQRIGARAAIRSCVRGLAAAYRPWVRPEGLRAVCSANADHMAELLRSFPAQAEDMHGAEADMCAPEGLAYHTMVTEALGFVLGELRDSMHYMAGLINVMAEGPFPGVSEPAAPPWQGGLHPSVGGGMANTQLQQRGFVAMVCYDMGHMLTLADAGRVMRRLAVNGTIPVMKNYEVENMHVLVYRMLNLSPEQRVSLAAHWHLWERRRRSLDTPVATARNLLVSLPQFIPLPSEFAQRIFDIADGVLAPLQPPAWPQHAQHAPWERESVVPLLGAAADVTAAASEALRVLRYALSAESGIGVEMTGQRLQPGELLGLEQLLRLYSVHLLHQQAPQIDFMALCQLAATQLRWEEQRRRPAYDRWQALQAGVGDGGALGADDLLRAGNLRNCLPQP